MLRKIVRKLTPPVILDVVRLLNVRNEPQQSHISWTGNYQTWAEAKANSTGYEAPLILEKCATALKKVRDGEVAYERDSALFDEIKYNWGLLAVLENSARRNNGYLSVLDFGGSLGSTYYQCLPFIKDIPDLHWCVVEQSHFVDKGREEFANDQLRFYHTVEECILQHKPTVVLMSGVLQYLEDPFFHLSAIQEIGAEFIILDRQAVTEDSNDLITVQKVPESIYPAIYPAWFFSISTILRATEKKYQLVANDPDFLSESIMLHGKKASWRFLLFKQKAAEVTG